MRLDLEVRGDPAACREVAGQLDRLGETVDEAADCLVREAHLSEADFGGLAGDAFRGHAGSLAALTDDSARRCRLLGRALAGLADGLEDAERLMESARTLARPWLVVTPSAVEPPISDQRVADAWTVQAWEVWRRVVLVVDQAREVERRAQHDWRAALRRYADDPPASTPWDGNPTHDDWPLGDPDTPDDPASGPHPGSPAPAAPAAPAASAAVAAPAAVAAAAGSASGVATSAYAGPGLDAASPDPSAGDGPGGRPPAAWGVGHDPVPAVGYDPVPAVGSDEVPGA